MMALPKVKYSGNIIVSLSDLRVRNASRRMKQALAEVGDFKTGGRVINKVRFANDTAIIAKTQEELMRVSRSIIAD